MTGLAGDLGVAKDKKQATRKNSRKPKSPAAEARPPRSKAQKMTKTADKTGKKAGRGATAKARELATNPAVAEIVAASLVAAAGALQKPTKPRGTGSGDGEG